MVEDAPHVVGRVGSLLRAVSRHEPTGTTTSVLARDAGLARPTAHRLLVSLAKEGLVDRNAGTGRWLLGPELYLLGTGAAVRYDVTALAQPIVRRLCVMTEESAFYSTRRGEETVCLIREDGSFPLRSHVLYEGIRFPLGVASAGIAVLAFLRDHEIDAFLASTDLVVSYGEQHAPGAIRERLTEARRLGYAVNPGLLVEGSWGMAAAVFGANGDPVGALSLTGVAHRFASARRVELGRLLLQSAHELSKRLNAPREP
jgi:DNA-binding IclR family transcriptional regulator